jgi:hypothetical protein
MPEPDPKSPRTEVVHLVCDAIGENDAFLWQQDQDAYDEAIALVNNAIDAMISASSSPTPRADYTETVWAFLSHHALLPLANAMVVDLFTGNLPGCFMLLRLLVETLAKCWVADSSHPGLPFFGERLQAPEDEGKSTSRILCEAGRSLAVGDALIALWGDLSRNWLHVPGYASKVVDTISATGRVPAWVLAIPMNYSSTDLEAIREFGPHVRSFRRILASARLAGGSGEPFGG